MKKQWITILSTFLTLAASLHSAEAEDRIPVGDRELSFAERVELKKKLQKEGCEEEKTEEARPRSLSNKKSIPTPKALYYTSHDGALHSPVFVDLYAEKVELEDGSIWSIYGGDVYKTCGWLTSDLIIIVPNDNIFSMYEYKLINANTSHHVEVNLVLGPIYKGFYTHWILAIDYLASEIILEDGSVWNMAFSDAFITDIWLPNDTVIMGINDGILSSMYPNILINVNTITNARGNCIN